MLIIKILIIKLMLAQVMSTIIVAGTLLINAGAVLNFKLSADKEESFGEEVCCLILNLKHNC